MNKQPLNKSQLNKHKSFQTSLPKVPSESNSEIQNCQNKMDAKMVENIGKDDPYEETLQLTTRWKEIAKPGGYRFTQGQWRKYTPPRTLRAEKKGFKWNCGRNKIKLSGKEWRTTAGKHRRRQTEKASSAELLRKSGTCRKETKQEPVAAIPNNHQTGNKS